MALRFRTFFSAVGFTAVLTLGLPAAFSPAQEKQVKGVASVRPLRLSPAELFSGDLKRLEPHLGLTARGCITLDCSVSGLPQGTTVAPLPVQIQLQVWENGKARSLSSMTPSLAEPRDLSISVREVPHAKEGLRYRVTTAIGGKGGNSFATQDIPLPKAEKEFESRFLTVRRLEKALEVKGAQPVSVWLLASDKGTNKAAADESLEQVAKRVEWALVLSVTVTDKK